MASGDEGIDREKLFLIGFLVVAIMFANYFLIFLADAVVNTSNVYVEEGRIVENSVIPSEILPTLMRENYSNRYTELTISGINGSCILRVIGSDNKNYNIKISRYNNTYKIELRGSQTFYVKEIKGNLSYKYRLYEETRPYSFLSIIALFISIVGFAISFYILYGLLLEKILMRRSRRIR